MDRILGLDIESWDDEESLSSRMPQGGAAAIWAELAEFGDSEEDEFDDFDENDFDDDFDDDFEEDLDGDELEIDDDDEFGEVEFGEDLDEEELVGDFEEDEVGGAEAAPDEESDTAEFEEE